MSMFQCGNYIQLPLKYQSHICMATLKAMAAFSAFDHTYSAIFIVRLVIMILRPLQIHFTGIDKFQKGCLILRYVRGKLLPNNRSTLTGYIMKKSGIN